MDKAYLLLMLVLPAIAMACRVVAFSMLDGKLRTPLWNCALDQLKAVGLYGLLGPPVGAWPLLVTGVFLQGDLRGLAVVVPGMLMSHAFGALPAMTTGAVVGALRPWIPGWRALAVGGVVGAVQTFLLLAAASMAEKWEHVAIFAAAGAFAGVVCALTFVGLPGMARRSA